MTLNDYQVRAGFTALYPENNTPGGLPYAALGLIGGASGGPDVPYRLARPGEACGAEDHE